MSSLKTPGQPANHCTSEVKKNDALLFRPPNTNPCIYWMYIQTKMIIFELGSGL